MLYPVRAGGVTKVLAALAKPPAWIDYFNEDKNSTVFASDW